MMAVRMVNAAVVADSVGATAGAVISVVAMVGRFPQTVAIGWRK